MFILQQFMHYTILLYAWSIFSSEYNIHSDIFDSNIANNKILYFLNVIILSITNVIEVSDYSYI